MVREDLTCANMKLLKSHEEIARLNAELAKMQLECAAKLEGIQAHH